MSETPTSPELPPFETQPEEIQAPLAEKPPDQPALSTARRELNSPSVSSAGFSGSVCKFFHMCHCERFLRSNLPLRRQNGDCFDPKNGPRNDIWQFAYTP